MRSAWCLTTASVRSPTSHHPIGKNATGSRKVESPASVLDHTVYRRDVGMAQRRQQPRLALEPRGPIRAVGNLGREDLDGDIAAQPGVVRAIDLTHAAASQQRDDGEAADVASMEAGHTPRQYIGWPSVCAGDCSRKERRAGGRHVKK